MERRHLLFELFNSRQLEKEHLGKYVTLPEGYVRVDIESFR